MKSNDLCDFASEDFTAVQTKFGTALTLFNKKRYLYIERKGKTAMDIGAVEIAQERREAAFRAAAEEGLLGTKDGSIGGRVPMKLLERAKERSGVDSTSELLLYALTKVALEDDFGRRLVARKGSVSRGTFAD